MRKIFLVSLVLAMLVLPSLLFAWDGFDAETADLVEVTPDNMPNVGDTIEIRSYEEESSYVALVESVKRNVRTIELLVRLPNGKQHILVMESR